jgi:ATP-binding cassette subfamily F protein 3
MDIVKGHRYGLIGRNGVGKTTLLRQLASGSIPGLPRGMIIRMVKQQVDARDDQTTLEALVEADEYRTALLEEQDEVERKFDSGIDLTECAKRLSDIAVELDAIDADNAEERAMNILKGLSFTKEMIHGTTINLSGGWRMRLALAQALFSPSSDLILLDECTNHLDLHGMAWLENYLTTKPLTIICVSHDRSFLDAVSTDIMVLEHKRLTYHAGNYTNYKNKMNEKASRESQILDASERQRTKAIAFVQKQQQQSKKSSDPNKQRQAKMIKDKKLDRIGNYREDGKRYKQNSLKKLSEDYVRLAQKVVIEVDEPVVKLRLPDPSWPPCITDGSPLIQMEDINFSYDNSAEPDDNLLLKQLTLNITRKTKAAVVGANGCGKSSLLKLIVGVVCLTKRQGVIRRHPNIRVGFISQYSVEDLNKYAHMTVVEYAEGNLSSGEVCSSITSKASGNIRQYLGMFGLGGDHANRPIRALSGGERMRLCFASVLASTVHVLLLDEATNHIDLETMDSLSNAFKDWQGAIIMVSHNQSFLSGFCNELWSFSEEEKGKIDISHDDTESFEELFLRYKSNILAGVGGTSISTRGERHLMAKRAARQNANVSRHTVLL